LTIWRDVQTARNKYRKDRGLKNLGDLQLDVEQKDNYVLGLVIRAEQTYEKWLADNSYLTEEFKKEHRVEILNWFTQVENEKIISAVENLISLYSCNEDSYDASAFKNVLDSSIRQFLGHNSIKCKNLGLVRQAVSDKIRVSVLTYQH
jgi:hypothetical protein